MDSLDFDGIIEGLEKISIELESKNEWTMAKTMEHIKSSVIELYDAMFDLHLQQKEHMEELELEIRNEFK